MDQGKGGVGYKEQIDNTYKLQWPISLPLITVIYTTISNIVLLLKISSKFLTDALTLLSHLVTYLSSGRLKVPKVIASGRLKVPMPNA